MGTLSRGVTYGATESITNTKLHNLVDLGSVTNIVNADIASGAAIAYSKLSLTGSIVNADISASAAIAYSKLTLTGAVVNADISASAAIVDTKLAQITTASKVHGSSLTGLASVPSGAGILPIANIASGTPTGSKFVRDDGTLAATGAFKLISNTAISAATNSGNIAITNTKFYQVNVSITTLSADDIILIRINNSTGTEYEWAYNGKESGSATELAAVGTGQTSINTGGAFTTSSDSYKQNISFKIFPQAGTGSKHLTIQGQTFGRPTAGSGPGFVDFFGNWGGSADATSFRILTSGGANITGNVIVYEMETA